MTDTALFVSVPTAAELLGISDDTVYDLVARGELPCAEFGRRKMVPRRAIDLVLERALDGFDPDALLVRLAGAAGASPPGGTSTTATGPGDEPHSTPRLRIAPPSSGAPAAVTR